MSLGPSVRPGVSSGTGFQQLPCELLNNFVVREAKSSFFKHLGVRPWGEIISRCWIRFDRDLWELVRRREDFLSYFSPRPDYSFFQLPTSRVVESMGVGWECLGASPALTVAHHCATLGLPLSSSKTCLALWRVGGGHFCVWSWTGGWTLLAPPCPCVPGTRWPLLMHAIPTCKFNQLEIKNIWGKYITSVLNRFRLCFCPYSPNNRA